MVMSEIPACAGMTFFRGSLRIVTVHSLGDFLTGLTRHTCQSRYPGILATLGLYFVMTFLDSGLRRNDALPGKATHQV